MRPPDFVRTSAFRLALVYAALFSLSVLLLFALIYVETAGYMTRQIDSSIRLDLAALQAEYRYGGIADVAAGITGRLAIPNGPTPYYLLQNSAGKVLAGNLPARAAWLGRSTIPVDDRSSETGVTHVRLMAARWPNGDVLVVGRSEERFREFRWRLAEGLGWGVAATIVLAIGGGLVMSGASTRRLEEFGRITAEIMEGDLGRRVPLRGTGDEFDRLARQVNTMLDRIQALMAGLKQVSNDIAHDLRTPLTRLRQALEIARDRAVTTADYADAIDRALTESDAILRTFGALLRIAQIEAGGRRMGFAEFDLSAHLETVYDAYQAVADESGHRLSASFLPGLPMRGDRELIVQMISNLIENALRHTPSGSTIVLTLSQVGETIEIVLADDGPGIPTPERQNVFQRFYRLDCSRSTPGNGLGLSLVAAIAGLHQIEIRLEDNAPGLRVRMILPRLRSTDVDAAASTALTPATSRTPARTA
jgi:signal transduction histidine kinase